MAKHWLKWAHRINLFDHDTPSKKLNMDSEQPSGMKNPVLDHFCGRSQVSPRHGD
jgi:hypothetical protein